MGLCLDAKTICDFRPSVDTAAVFDLAYRSSSAFAAAGGVLAWVGC